jgi:hypothetical protein
MLAWQRRAACSTAKRSTRRRDDGRTGLAKKHPSKYSPGPLSPTFEWQEIENKGREKYGKVKSTREELSGMERVRVSKESPYLGAEASAIRDEERRSAGIYKGKYTIIN